MQSKTVVLQGPHTHNRVRHVAGTKLTLQVADADYLIQVGKAVEDKIIVPGTELTTRAPRNKPR
jgi:hypothetical protein